MSSVYKKSSCDDLFGTASFGGGGFETAYGTLDSTETVQCAIAGGTAALATAATGAGAPVSWALGGITFVGCLMYESID